MIVGKEELEELQGFIQKQIKEIQKADSSSPELFSLETLNSNISMVFSYTEGEGSSTVELGSRDKIIIDALESYRAEFSSKQSEDPYVGQISYFAETALTYLKKIKEVLPSSEKIFSSNINAVLSQIMPDLKTLSGMDSNAKLVQKLKSKDLTAAKAEAQVSSSTVKSTTSATATRTAATKTSSSVAAKKTTSTKTVKSTKTTDTKPVAKRGRPRKSE